MSRAEKDARIAEVQSEIVCLAALLDLMAEQTSPDAIHLPLLACAKLAKTLADDLAPAMAPEG